MKLNLTRFSLYLFAFVSIILCTSCGDDDEEDPILPNIRYADTDVQLGTEGTISPTAQGVGLVYEIKDAGDAEDFVSINANSGVITVGKESKLGSYNVAILAYNELGESESVASIEITLNDNFNPVGKTFEWKFFINQSENVVLKGLDGLPELPISEMLLPIGLPDESTPAQEFPTYFVFTEMQKILLERLAQLLCPDGTSLRFTTDENLEMFGICNDGTLIPIGKSEIKFKDDQFVYVLDVLFEASGDFRIQYKVDNAVFTTFNDAYTDPDNPLEIDAVVGTVNKYTTPTDFTSSTTLADVSKIVNPTVDLVLEVITE